MLSNYKVCTHYLKRMEREQNISLFRCVLVEWEDPYWNEQAQSLFLFWHFIENFGNFSMVPTWDWLWSFRLWSYLLIKLLKPSSVSRVCKWSSISNFINTLSLWTEGLCTEITRCTFHIMAKMRSAHYAWGDAMLEDRKERVKC